MKVLVIPDVHLDVSFVDRILQQDYHKAFFLGDWYDSKNFDESEELCRTIRTTRFIMTLMLSPKHTFLWGNHDLSLYGGANYMGMYQCSGFTMAKAHAVDTMVRDTGFWDRFGVTAQLCSGDRRFLFSHAGLHKGYIMDIARPNWRVSEILEAITIRTSDAESAIVDKKHHPWLACGVKRGGWAQVGGPLWCDFSEYKPYSGITQMFGHTPKKKHRMKGADYCLDAGQSCYAVIEDGEVGIKYVKPISG